MVKKEKKKGESGAAKNFVTRNAAIKKLQVTLPDFRRLCILKGIYPREPRNKKKANKGSTAPTTFYYSKDIAYLMHEPVINKFREHKVFARKLTRALGKDELTTAKRLEDNRPTYTLDHIIKERYPTFLDALRDLDDALSMLFLFASIPSSQYVQADIIRNCERLCREFEHYVILSKSLRKVFLSIKGIYYQAEIKGQDITWLVPYKFAQQVPTDVDFRIMLTFLEFHQTFVGFINYRLYTELGLVYPPNIDTELDDEAAGLGAFDIRRIGLDDADAPSTSIRKPTKKQMASLNIQAIQNGEDGADDKVDEDTEMNEEDAEEVTEDIDDFTNVGPPLKEGEERQIVAQVTSTPTDLFSNFTFYLSREVPRYSLEFIIRAFGGKVSWDPILGAGSSHVESDPIITHHICDRPTQDKLYQGRNYLQPQWVYDCINRGTLQRADLYGIGTILPPHLSPFVKVSDGGYNPEEEMEAIEDEEVEAVAEEPAVEDSTKIAEEELTEEQVDAIQAQNELEAEAAGIPFSEFRHSSTSQTNRKKAKLSESDKLEEEGKELAKMMMTNKQKKLYRAVTSKTNRQDTETEQLRKRRLELARAKK